MKFNLSPEQIRLISLLVLTIVAGCGGGSTADVAPAPKPQPGAACTPRVVSVALLGDSTQFGINGFTSARVDADPGKLLQSAMDARFGAGAVAVTNYGVPGALANQSPRVSADVIVENFGINDAIAGESLVAYRAALSAIGATLVETPNPTQRLPLDVQAQYADAAARLGAPVADVFGYVQALPNWQAMIGPDRTHPGPELYARIVRDVLAPAVGAQVAPLRCQ